MGGRGREMVSRGHESINPTSNVVGEARIATREEINAWNEMYSADLNIMLLPVSWETHMAPQLGGRPQEMINKELVDNCDALVGMFWARLGSPTGAEDSGTVEEI